MVAADERWGRHSTHPTGHIEAAGNCAPGHTPVEHKLSLWLVAVGASLWGVDGDGEAGSGGGSRAVHFCLLAHLHAQLPPVHAAADHLVHKELWQILGRGGATAAGRGRSAGHVLEVDATGQRTEALDGCTISIYE